MEKQKIISLAYWIMIIVVILTCIFVVIYLKSNASQCLADPLTFYSEKIGQQCYCMDKSVFTP